MWAQVASDELENASRVAGAAAAATVIMLDAVMWLYSRAGLTKGNPVPPLVFMVGGRVALVRRPRIKHGTFTSRPLPALAACCRETEGLAFDPR